MDRADHEPDVLGNPGIGSNFLVRSLRTLNPHAARVHSTTVTAKCPSPSDRLLAVGASRA